MVNFIISQDKKKVFLFAALQSESGKKLLEQYHINWQRSDSFVVIEKDKAHMKSNAALKLYAKLPWYWRWTQIFWIVPKFIRDSLYNVVAKNRYKWFGKTEACIVPSANIEERFLE